MQEHPSAVREGGWWAGPKPRLPVHSFTPSSRSKHLLRMLGGLPHAQWTVCAGEAITPLSTEEDSEACPRAHSLVRGSQVRSLGPQRTVLQAG